MTRRVITYTTTDPDAPPNWRAVAMWFVGPERQTVISGGATEDEAAAKLNAFLDAEEARIRSRQENALASVAKRRAKREMVDA